MKPQSLLALAAPCLLPAAAAAAAAPHIDAIQPPRHREALDKSNDLHGLLGMEDVVETSPMYDCGGLHWAHPADQTGMKSTVVQYDYDVLLTKGADAEAAAASLQESLLRSVGEDIFQNCGARRLTFSQPTGGAAGIEKVTSNPADEVLPESCGIRELLPGTVCHAIRGYVTAYAPSSSELSTEEFVRRLDEGEAPSAVHQAIVASVETAMQSGALLTDDVQGVQYLGDRAAYKAALEANWWSEWGMYLVIALSSVFGVCLLCTLRRFCRRRANGKGKEAPDAASEDGTAPESPREDVEAANGAQYDDESVGPLCGIDELCGR